MHLSHSSPGSAHWNAEVVGEGLDFIKPRMKGSLLLQVDSQGANTAKDSHCDTECHKKLKRTQLAKETICFCQCF